MNITIIGLGVIGGSLGLAIRQSVPGAVVTGFDDEERTGSALNREAVHYGATSLAASVHDADIIFLCTPVRTIISLMPAVAAACRKNAIITDVGSTKGEIVTAAKKAFRRNGLFVGGHPMAGSEGKGIEHADPLLFQNATYVLCAEKPKAAAIAPLTRVLHAVGARVLFLPARDHDTIAAAISHLPQLVAVAMMGMVAAKSRTSRGYLQLAAGGFRDITRIASSPYGMWRDILSTNAAGIRRIIREFAGLLLRYERDLRSDRSARAFARRFTAAKTMRDAIPKNSKGFLHPLFELYVSASDTPGVLSEMTTALFKAKLNIKDIELLKIRDGRGGTFRLSFETRQDAERARIVLHRRNFTAL
ncbi:MAG: prephenate dehydrogenase/arogenate dehydrogenase family protein [Bacteroidetes bacterium]|nr:prephenate dehydrogenase/arogenate dehydrogenase family protein [Bacteroidota bacterium]